MNKIELLLTDLIEREELLGLNNYKIAELPIWRLVRFYSRYKVLKTVDPRITNNSLKRDKIRVFVNILKRLCSSCFSFFKFLCSKKNIENVIFAFPRLQNLNGILVDKFTDPVIDQSNLNESCVVFQTYGSSIYKGIRWKKERVINIDFLYAIAFILAYLYIPFHYLSSNHLVINKLFGKAKSTFLLTRNDLLKWHVYYCRCYILSLIYKLIFSHIKTKRIFVVDRGVFYPAIIAAHKLNIVVYEIQHGVTHGNTVLYSGNYSEIIDPDYFLSFGEKWRGTQFSIPLDRIINIGWAYKDFISNFLTKQDVNDNAILFISSPEITTKIINVIIELSIAYPQKEFHIRCHPQEMIPYDLNMSISSIKNIYVTDNTIDSYIALSSYNYIVGENSTVLYEALSLGKNVARLSYNGFSPSGRDKTVYDGFFYLDSKGDFELYLNNTVNHNENDNIYSSFKANVVNELI